MNKILEDARRLSELDELEGWTLEPFSRLEGPPLFVVQTRPRGKNRPDVATFYRATGFNMTNGKLVAVPTADPSAPPIEVEYEVLSNEDDGRVNYIADTAQEAWAWCKSMGVRPGLVGSQAS